MVTAACFGAVDGWIGCHTCAQPPSGWAGSLGDGCVDDTEWAVNVLFTIAAGAGVIALRALPCRWLALAMIGIVFTLSSAYHLLFGEGVGDQSSAFRQAINTRTITILTQTAVLGSAASALTAGCCSSSCCGPFWRLRAAIAGYTAAAGGVAGIAAQDSALREFDFVPDPIYGIFDLTGVVLGAYIIATATAQENSPDSEFE